MGSTRIVDPGPIFSSEYDDFEYCDAMIMTSYPRDAIDDVTNRRAVGTFSIGHEPLNYLVSDIFSIKVADRQTHTDRQTSR